jgi:predicted nucleotidyltransferase
MSNSEHGTENVARSSADLAADGVEWAENVRIDVPRDSIEVFCRKWRVRELSLFGSVLRDDFRPDSDVDVLVVFDDDAGWDLWDHLHAEEELAQLLGREVDLVTKSAVRNPFRRHHILNHRKVIYAT